MDCPDQIKRIYMEERERRRVEDNFLDLHRRKGRAVDRELDLALLEESKAEELLSVWYSFHEQAAHKTYDDFYSKVLYCLRLDDTQIDAPTFLALIADREFLFLEYNEAYITDYPPLSCLVKSANAEEANYFKYKEKQEKVLRQAFVPTNAHLVDYNRWLENLAELNKAQEQRQEQLLRLIQMPESFSINIEPSDSTNSTGVPPYPVEAPIGKLFSSYLDTSSSAGLLQCKGEPNQGEMPWRPAIHSVMKNIAEADNKIPGFAAIVFFHLFTQNTQKLSDGTLKRYTFKSFQRRKSYLEDPMVSQARIHARIRYNILLYDQLLELFIKHELPDSTEEELARYRADAKFVFYKYSRLDRYWHYDLIGFWNKGVPNIHFEYSENYKDGVDFFGNLLRFHINYSMSNKAKWLLPVLSGDTRNPPLSVLATFLLSEGSAEVVAKNRLVNRVQALSKSTLREMLKKYESDYLDEAAKRDDLHQWVREHNLHIPHEDELLYEERGQRSVIQNCGQYVLEFFLRDRLIQASKEVLCKVAKIYFDDLCLGEFSYGKAGSAD